MFWLAVFVLLQITHLASTQDIKLEFLRVVPRLFNETTTRDYYFSCSVEGRFLQWEYNNLPLSGFRINDIGRVVVDERSDYTYTATLLSSLPMENRQAIMDSVLVMSFDDDMDPGQFMITCSSNHNITNITTTHDPIRFVKNTKANGGVQLDYVTSGNIVSNRTKTHIFMCGVQSTSQFIEVIGPTLGFSRFDDIGRARAVFSQDGNTADIQGILIARKSTQSVTLILIASEFEEVSVSCYDTVSHIFLPSRSVDSEVATKIPKPTTAPTVNDASTIIVTDDPIDFTEEIRTPTIAWLLPTILTSLVLPVAAVIAVILAIFMSRNHTNDFTKPSKPSNSEIITLKEHVELTDYHEDNGKLGSSVEPAEMTSPSISQTVPVIMTDIRKVSSGIESQSDAGESSGSEGCSDSAFCHHASNSTDEHSECCDLQGKNAGADLQAEQPLETESSMQGSGSLSQAELDLISEEGKAETVSEEENIPEEDIVSVSNNQELCLELEHEPEHGFSHEETSCNGKTSATATFSKPSQISIEGNSSDMK